MEFKHPFISICIPAFKRAHYLKRLLDSIVIQQFKNFEVVISDDSDDDTVFNLIQSYTEKIEIKYFKNQPSYGTPSNWNFAITRANGEWIKLMHDDDWFSDSKSLGKFAENTQLGNRFICSAYSNYFENLNSYKLVIMSLKSLERIKKYPLTLLSENVIGPPSVTMVHRSIQETYDERMKWRVDLDFYIRILLLDKKITYIKENLINVGISESQVTNYCINIPSVELPEGYLLLHKYGVLHLKNIIVFDAWWRIIRNLKITSKDQLELYGQKEWPKVILQIIKTQKIFPYQFLRIGIFSKCIMFVSYVINRINSNI